MVTVLALLSGCGLFDSDEEEGADARDGATSGDNQAPTAAGDRLAAEAMLSVDDFPDGWASEAINDAFARSILENTPGCFPDVSALDQELAGAAGSRSFTHPNGNRVDARVVVFDGPDEASAFIELLRGQAGAIEECVSSILGASRSELGFPADTPIDPVFAADSGLGDDSATVAATIGPATVRQSWIQVDEAVTIVVLVDATDDFDAMVYTDLLIERMRTVFS